MISPFIKGDLVLKTSGTLGQSSADNSVE